MKNSEKQPIINSFSSDVVELPPLLPPQSELISKMYSFLDRQNQPKPEESYLSFLRHCSLYGEDFNEDQKNVIKDFLGIGQDKELPDRIWDLIQKTEKEKKAAIEKIIDPDGVCRGLAVLWSFGKNLEDQGLNGDEFDNIAFMRRTANILVNWNGYAELEDQDKKDIERFISNIRTYQSSIDELLAENAQGPTGEVLYENTQEPLTEDLRKTVLNNQGLRLFETTKKLPDGTYQRVNKQLDEIVTTDISGLVNRLEDIMKQPGKMVIIRISGETNVHSLSAYKAKDDTMYFYDPNTGEKEVESIEHLAKEIQSASESLYPESKIGLIDFGVRIYDYTDRVESSSLDKQKFLTTTEDELKSFMKSADLSKIEDRSMLYMYLAENKAKVAALIMSKDSDTLDFMRESGLSDIIDLEGSISSEYIDYILSDLYNNHESISKLLNAGALNKDIGYVLHQYKILCFGYDSESYESFKTFKQFVFKNVDSVVSFVQKGHSLQQIKAEYDKFPKEQRKDYSKIITQIAEAFQKISTEETTKEALPKMTFEKLSATEEVDNNTISDQEQLEQLETEEMQNAGVSKYNDNDNDYE
jgi:hypothetical protein